MGRFLIAETLAAALLDLAVVEVLRQEVVLRLQEEPLLLDHRRRAAKSNGILSRFHPMHEGAFRQKLRRAMSSVRSTL